jgi:hypothetical protein
MPALLTNISPAAGARRILAIVIGLALVGLLMAQSLSAAKGPKILEFDTMVGVPTALTGAAGAIRGVNGAGIAWAIGPSKGELSTTGHLEITVRGLVFAAGPNTGSNTIATFGAIVSCLAADGSVVNVSAGSFPATTGAASEGGGNADIEADLSLPQPCIAPIVFVTSPGGAWFATIGG